MTMIVPAPRTFAEAERILAETLPNYTHREQQGVLAEAVESIFANGGQGILQAGTGTGKSVGYIVPAILSGKRVIVATSTKALQEQIAGKDMPFLEANLGKKFTWAVLKGRGNYLCQQKMHELSEADVPELAEIYRLLKEHVGGDIEHFEIPTMNGKWGQLTSSSTECPGKSDCPFGETCFAEKAKNDAAEADIVITNTAMLMLDLRIRQLSDDTVQMLGEYDYIVIDEAHELPEIATNTLSEELKFSQIDKLARDVMGWVSGQRKAVQEGEEATPEQDDLRQTMEIVDRVKLSVTELWMKLEDKRGYDEDGKPNREPIQVSQVWLTQDENSEVFLQILDDIRALHDKMREIRTQNGGTAQVMQKRRIMRRCTNMETRLARLLMDSDSELVRWLETETRNVRGGGTEEILVLKASPIEVGPFLREMLWDITPTVMVSATLAVGESFDYIVETLGLTDHNPLTIDVGTPFDYQHQARLFVPAKNMPSPKKGGEWEGYARQTMLDLVRASGGGALLLFTSRTNMNATYDAIAPVLQGMGIRCLKQGDQPNKVLAREFKNDTNSCLFALKSFFVGVDFQGRTCRLVVIDKLPFPVPTDILFAARCAAYELRNGAETSFGGISIPVMTLTLVQGFGRLIRHLEDSGVVAILDSRLRAGWAKGILRSLPPAPVVGDMRRVEEFYGTVRVESVTTAA